MAYFDRYVFAITPLSLKYVLWFQDSRHTCVDMMSIINGQSLLHQINIKHNAVSFSFFFYTGMPSFICLVIGIDGIYREVSHLVQ